MKKGGLLLAGIAAYALYRYNKMSQDEKDKLASNIKAKGQKLYDDYVPEDVKRMFGKKSEETSNHYGEGSAYTS